MLGFWSRANACARLITHLLQAGQASKVDEVGFSRAGAVKSWQQPQDIIPAARRFDTPLGRRAASVGLRLARSPEGPLWVELGGCRSARPAAAVGPRAARPGGYQASDFIHQGRRHDTAWISMIPHA